VSQLYINHHVIDAMGQDAFEILNLQAAVGSLKKCRFPWRR
jgi:hypothetical protein